MSLPWETTNPQQQQLPQQQMAQQQGMPGPQGAAAVQTMIPAVQTPPVMQTGGFGTAQQQLGQAMQVQQSPVVINPPAPQFYAHQQPPQTQPAPGGMHGSPMQIPAGVNPLMPGQEAPIPQAAPVVPPSAQDVIGGQQYAPQQMPAQVPGQFQGQQQQQFAPQQAPPPQQEYAISPENFPQVEEGVLQSLVDRAADEQVPAHSLDAFVAQELQNGAAPFQYGGGIRGLPGKGRRTGRRTSGGPWRKRGRSGLGRGHGKNPRGRRRWAC